MDVHKYGGHIRVEFSIAWILCVGAKRVNKLFGNFS
jgi:hypothetical protein